MQRDNAKDKNVAKRTIRTAHLRLITHDANFAQLDSSTRVSQPARLEAGTYSVRVFSSAKEFIEDLGTLGAGQIPEAVISRYADGKYNPGQEIIYLKQKGRDSGKGVRPARDYKHLDALATGEVESSGRRE